MKAIFILVLLLAASACDKSRKEARAPEDYRKQGAVDEAHSELTNAVAGLNQQAFTAHTEWMRVETIKRELEREERAKEKEALTKELAEASTAEAGAKQAYDSQVQRIEAAAKSSRALLDAAAKPKSLKLLETEIISAEQLLRDLEEWRKRSDAAARRLLDTVDSEEKHEAQREYYKAAKQHRNLP